MVLCCARKLWTPVKEKDTENDIPQGFSSPWLFFVPEKTLFQGQIIVFLWHETRPAWHFEWQDGGENLTYFPLTVIFLSAFGSTNHYSMLIGFIWDTSHL